MFKVDSLVNFCNVRLNYLSLASNRWNNETELTNTESMQKALDDGKAGAYRVILSAILNDKIISQSELSTLCRTRIDSLRAEHEEAVKRINHSGGVLETEILVGQVFAYAEVSGLIAKKHFS